MANGSHKITEDVNTSVVRGCPELMGQLAKRKDKLLRNSESSPDNIATQLSKGNAEEGSKLCKAS